MSSSSKSHGPQAPHVVAHPLPLACETDLINPLLRVHDVARTVLRCAAPYDPALIAAEIFAVMGHGFLPVTESNRPVGVLTDRDLVLALHRHRGDLSSVRVRDIMTSPVLTIRASAKLDALIDLLGDHAVRRIVVVDDHGRLEGVVSWTDLVSRIPERGVGHAVSRIIQGRRELAAGGAVVDPGGVEGGSVDTAAPLVYGLGKSLSHPAQ